MSDELKIRTSALAEYVCDGNEALEFKMVCYTCGPLSSSSISFELFLSKVKTVEDFDNPEAGFLPEMCHQIYGDNENIFGYKGLKVKLYMSAGSLESFVTHEFDDKVDPAKTDGVTADDVISPLVKILAPGSFTDNKDQFLAHVNSEKEAQFR